MSKKRRIAIVAAILAVCFVTEVSIDGSTVAFDDGGKAALIPHKAILAL